MSAPEGEDLREEDAAALRRTSDRIEHLLGELRGSTSPAAWARIEELVSSLTGIYGRGLERVLAAFAGGRGIDEPARARLCDDPLVESLLLLHGLHPVPAEERVAHAVERVRQAVGASVGVIETAPCAGGSVAIRLAGDWRRCPVPTAAIEAALRRAIEEAAPEVTAVAIARDGLFATAAAAGASGADPVLVQIDLGRSRRRAPSEAVR